MVVSHLSDEDDCDFKQLSTWISIRFRVKNFRYSCTRIGNLMWRSLDSLDTRYRDFCCCSKAIFSTEKRVITIIILNYILMLCKCNNHISFHFSSDVPCCCITNTILKVQCTSLCEALLKILEMTP